MIRLKLFIALLFIGLVWSAQAQSSLPDTLITIQEKEKTIEELLGTISERSGVTFSYSSSNIPSTLKVSIDFTGASISTVLDEVLLGLDLEYEWVEGKMVLMKSPPGQQKVRHSISGYVRDNQTGEYLIGATIRIKGSTTGTVSNAYGFFSLTLPEGRYDLQISFIGYDEIERSILLNQNIKLNVSIEANIAELSEIIISPSDSLITMEATHANGISIDQSLILTKPTALGEADLIKSLDVIPGVQLFRDGSTFFNVRGGDRDQNQLLVDEAPIYNPAHLLGLFSSFMPEAIKDAKLYKGNAPAEYGGRVSSVMDIHTRDGNMKEVNLAGSAGFVSSRLSVEGPLAKDKSSFFLSGRRSHIGSILRAFGTEFDKLYFSDFTGKVNLKLNQSNRLFLSTFLSKDEYLNGGGLRWENKAGTIRWNHLFSDRLFLNTTVYTSRYDYHLIADEDLIWKNHITNASLKTDFTFFKNPKSTIKLGLKLSGHNFNPGNIENGNGIVFRFVPKRNASELSLYFSHDKQLGENWLLNYGFRLSTWTNYGRTIEYTIDEEYQVIDSTIYNNRTSYNSYSNLEPRLSLTWILGGHHYLKFNYTRSAQYINLISNSISPFNNLEVWLPASVNIKPQLGNQVSLAWIHDQSQWKFQVEGYAKSLENQLDYANQAQLLLNPHLEAELRSGDSWAHGVETSLTKKTGKLTGWITYSYSRSFRKINGVNQGQTYPTLWDRPHQLTTSLTYRVNKRSTFSGSFLLSSGAPNTRPSSYFQYADRTVPIYSNKNNSRLPTYHRFDVSWTHRLNKKEQKFNHFLGISVFNFYGQKNTILESFNKIEVENGAFKVPSSSNAGILTPTYRFVYGVVPSLTYSFRL